MIGKTEKSVASTIDAVLKALWRRGTNPQSHITKLGDRFLGVGICYAGSSHQGLYVEENQTTALDGFFYEEGNVNSKLLRNGVQGLAELVGLPGAFCFLSSTNKGLVAGRDPVGQKPLYSGVSSNGNLVLSSLKAGLQAIGAENPQPVPSGSILVASDRTLDFVDGSHKLREPSESSVRETDAVNTLHALLTEAVSKGIPKNPAIAFSGGLDSALIAVAARESSKDPELVTVGIEGQPELEHAHEVAAELGLPITISEVTPGEVLDSLSDVVSIVESNDPLIVGVSVPLYLACRTAREMGLTAIVAGQMSDELFGGYARFEELVVNGKPNHARAEMWTSVLAASTNDFEPGDKLAVSMGLELRCPFAYLPMVEYALRLPLSLKVNILGKQATRKHVLRRLAASLKLPDSVVQRPKKAVQYSTGVQKVLTKEAKRRNMTVGRFLNSFANRNA